MIKRIMTNAMVEEALRLRATGLSFKKIGELMGCSEDAIKWHCLKYGVEAPKNPWKPWNGIKGPAVVKRGNHVVRRFTADEDAKILTMREAGESLSAIGRALKRRHHSILFRLCALARKEDQQKALA